MLQNLTRIWFYLCSIFIWHQTTSAQLISPMLDDVYKFSTKEGKAGTCFRVNYDEKTYLVTCRHILPGQAKGDTIAIIIETDGTIKETPYIVATNNPMSVDAVVMEPVNFHLEESSIDIIDSVTVDFRNEYFMLGYPSVLPTDFYLRKTKYGTPEALVKNMRFAGRLVDSMNIEHLIFDGMAVGGFSGSPIVYFNKSTERWILIAINEGFLNDPASNESERIDSDHNININFNSGLNLSLSSAYIRYSIRPWR